MTTEVEFAPRDHLNSIFEKKHYLVKSSNFYLTKLHIQQMLKNSTVLTYKIDVFERNHEKIKEFLTKQNETVLVIECFKESELKFDFNPFENFHVIIIAKNDIKMSTNAIQSIENPDYSFNDLTEETRNKLINSRIVVFQGKKVLLKSRRVPKS